MNGHQQTHNPHGNQNVLFTHNRDGTPAPPGYAFNVIGQLVQLAYQPWMFGPQQAWENFDNQEFLAWGQSDATIEPQPSPDPNLPMRWGKDPLGRAVPPLTHEHFALVPNAQYIGRDRDDPERPTQDNGTLALTGIGGTGSPARINFRVPQSIVAYTMVPSPDLEFALSIQDPTQPTPLGVAPVQADIAHPPVGGCVSIVQMSIGHKGNTFDMTYDVPPGQIVKFPFGGSQGIIKTLLTPKYFTTSNELVTTFRNYLVAGPGSQPLTQPPGTPGGSSIWNDMTAATLPNNGFAGLTLANPNTTPFLSWFALAPGIVPIPETQAIRRFYGTVQCTNTVPNPLTAAIVNPEGIQVSPVAYGATVVELSGNPGLQFVVRTNDPFIFYGPYPANLKVTLPGNATSILVYESKDLSQVGNPIIEVPYELLYYMSA
jgi:hypothetical protein